MPQSPVLGMHRQAGAALTQAGGWDVPSRYSVAAAEYDALYCGAALIDRSHTGRLELAGDDALDLLSRLSTNALMDLEVGQGMYTVLTSNKGRIKDLLFVLRRPDSLLVLTAPKSRADVVDWVDFYTFTEDVAVRDVTEETAMLSLAGPEAATRLSETSGIDATALAPHGYLDVRIGPVETAVIRTDFLRLPGFDLVTTADQGPQLWEALLQAGARPVGFEAQETARVEQGVPAYGSELTEDFNPLEANLLEYVSFTKGCYVGQEVVTRLNTYQKVQKQLVGLRWDPQSAPVSGAKLLAGGKKVGVVTSAAPPDLHRGAGLGYVRNAHAQVGTELALELEDGETTVLVAALPLVAEPSPSL